MQKGKEVIGRKIVTLDGGERIDSVRDLIFDEQGNRVLALLVDEGGWFHAAKVIPFSSVKSIGDDAVMIGSADDVVSARDDATIAAAMESKSGLAGLNLITTDGKELGRIADVFFDEVSGQVVGYEATGGLFSDLSSGRTFVPAPESVTIGAEAAIVPPAVAHAMEEQEAGGLQGAFSSVSESVKGAAGTVAGTVKETAGNIAQATKDRQKEFVVGRTAGSDVAGDDGVVLVSKGETITAEQAQKAETLGLLGSLTAAAGGGAAQEMYGSARENVQAGYENMATATKDRQKEFVVGKTAGSDVVAGDGSPIVMKGETITAIHAGTAEDKGALGSLVASATGGSMQEGVQGVRETIVARTTPTPASLIGRRVQRDVYGPNRSFVAAQGQIVTEALLERARTLGKEEELREAVGAVGSTGGAGSTVSAASDRLSAGAQNVKEGASGLLDRAKGWIADTRDKATEEVEERRIEGAIGRPVNRVVLDKQDSIILNIGEIVTHKAVEQARSSEVLGILLSSISTETPSIDPMTVRPDEHGQAALPSQPEIKKPDGV
ncbi:PRC-barrel domain-containing protein [Deinococcus altitudinis]|uniref:PRC-barrel domain-containing protein n=1 Tax=Deinococcus altitudinis TaxID=468914 RepID=UPI003891DF7B